MLDRQQLVCTLGASVVISGTDGFFTTPRPRKQGTANPPRVTANDFGVAVRTLLSGSTSLGACLSVD